MCHNYSLLEDYIRENYKQYLDCYEEFYNLSCKSYSLTNIIPHIYGFIIPLSSFKAFHFTFGYIFLIYFKYPDNKRIYVSKTYFSFDECDRDAVFYLRQFPYYGFSSLRNF